MKIYLHPHKINFAIKHETELVLRLSSNMISKSNDETNFPHKLLLTNRQVASLCEDVASKSSTDIMLSKIQLSNMIQSGGFRGEILGS